MAQQQQQHGPQHLGEPAPARPHPRLGKRRRAASESSNDANVGDITADLSGVSIDVDEEEGRPGHDVQEQDEMDVDDLAEDPDNPFGVPTGMARALRQVWAGPDANEDGGGGEDEGQVEAADELGVPAERAHALLGAAGQAGPQWRNPIVVNGTEGDVQEGGGVVMADGVEAAGSTGGSASESDDEDGKTRLDLGDRLNMTVAAGAMYAYPPKSGKNSLAKAILDELTGFTLDPTTVQDKQLQLVLPARDKHLPGKLVHSVAVQHFVDYKHLEEDGCDWTGMTPQQYSRQRTRFLSTTVDDVLYEHPEMLPGPVYTESNIRRKHAYDQGGSCAINARWRSLGLAYTSNEYLAMRNGSPSQLHVHVPVGELQFGEHETHGLILQEGARQADLMAKSKLRAYAVAHGTPDLVDHCPPEFIAFFNPGMRAGNKSFATTGLGSTPGMLINPLYVHKAVEWDPSKARIKIKMPASLVTDIENMIDSQFVGMPYLRDGVIQQTNIRDLCMTLASPEVAQAHPNTGPQGIRGVIAFKIADMCKAGDFYCHGGLEGGLTAFRTSSKVYQDVSTDDYLVYAAAEAIAVEAELARRGQSRAQPGGRKKLDAGQHVAMVDTLDWTLPRFAPRMSREEVSVWFIGGMAECHRTDLGSDPAPHRQAPLLIQQLYLLKLGLGGFAYHHPKPLANMSIAISCFIPALFNALHRRPTSFYKSTQMRHKMRQFFVLICVGHPGEEHYRSKLGCVRQELAVNPPYRETLLLLWLQFELTEDEAPIFDAYRFAMRILRGTEVYRVSGPFRKLEDWILIAFWVARGDLRGAAEYLGMYMCRRPVEIRQRYRKLWSEGKLPRRRCHDRIHQWAIHTMETFHYMISKREKAKIDARLAREREDRFYYEQEREDEQEDDDNEDNAEF